MSFSNNRITSNKSSNYNNKSQSLSEIKTKISKIYNEEYEENFNQILVLTEEQFFSLINKRVNLVISDSLMNYVEEQAANINSILKGLENEKKTLYKKEYNYIELELKSFVEINISYSKNIETHDKFNFEKAKLMKHTLSSNPSKKENEIPFPNKISINDLFEFIAKSDDKRDFYFRKHCIFNKNHALHACYNEQIVQLNHLKETSKTESIKNLSLEETNFFLPLYETSYKNYLNRISLEENKGFKTSRNIISLNTSYSNFISNVRKSNFQIKEDQYKNPKRSFHKESENGINKNNKIKYLICLLCKKVYEGNSVLMHCDFCSLPFYTCLQESKEEFIFPATWEKYHCGAIVNDQMRCLKCKAYLSLNTKSNKLICSGCNLIYDPAKIKWKCLVCNEDFKSNAKIYNPLEFKLIKLAIKNAILNKISVLPEEIDCCMEIREKIVKSGFNINNLEQKANEKFYLKHKMECPGLLYEGNLYNRKIVVCSECKTFVNYDKFIWFCPFCNKRYRKRNCYLEASDANKVKEIEKEKEKVKAKDNSRSFNYNKDEPSIEMKKKINSKDDLVYFNYDTFPDAKKLIQDTSKNSCSENKNYIKIAEKEKLMIPNRASNVSKVIKINANNNDNLIMDKLKSKFSNPKFSTNFDSFITKAVNSKRSPLFKEAVNRSINLNFSIKDLTEYQNKHNHLNFSFVNSGSPDHAKEKTDSSKQNGDKSYFTSSNNTNSNNDSSNNSTFKINNANNNKLKVTSLKETKSDNQPIGFENEFSYKNKIKNTNYNEALLEKDHIVNYEGKENKVKLDDSSLNYKITFKQETIESQSNIVDNNDLYEIVKEDPKSSDCEYEINIGKEELTCENNKALNKEKPSFKSLKLEINVDESSNENSDKNKNNILSVRNSKVNYNGFFKNFHSQRSLNIDKLADNSLQNSINFDEDYEDLNASGLIYNRKSLMLRKNSDNNIVGNHAENLLPIHDIFKKDNITRVKNKIYVNSLKLDNSIVKKDKEEINQGHCTDTGINISDILYIPAKQRINLIKKTSLSNFDDKCLFENFETETKMDSIPLEIMYKTEEERKKIYANSSLNAGSDTKNSYEKNKIGSNLHCKINRYSSSINSNNNLNDLSTSSISHNNKFINNCYLSKKSSDNQIFTNLQYSRSNKVNYYNNILDKKSFNVSTEESYNGSKKNIIRHQSLIFTKKRQNLLSKKDSFNISTKSKDNLIHKLETYFSLNIRDINYEKNSKIDQRKKDFIKEISRENSKSGENVIYRRNNSMSRDNNNNKIKSNLHNYSSNNLIKNLNENIESEFFNNSGVFSSSQTLSNINNINIESKSNIYDYAKKNSNNSNKSFNLNFNSLNNKDGNVIKEIIDEDLLELDYSCSKSRMRKSVSLNTNSIKEKTCSRIKDNLLNNNNNINNNDFACIFPFTESKESEKEEDIEIIFSQHGYETIKTHTNTNFRFDKNLDLNEKLKRIKLESKDQDINFTSAPRNFLNEVNINASNKKIQRKNIKASPDQNLDTYPSNTEIFDFSSFTYRKDNLDFTERNSNIGNSAKGKSNKKVDFIESEIIFSEQSQSPNKFEIKYEIINFNSPPSISTKKADFNSSSIKNSIKSSSSLISIVNTSQNNNYMVDENNINFLIEDFTFNLDEYIIEKSIGEGAFASVFAASSKLNFKKYAIKKIIVDDISHINNIISEVRILSKFNHENIILIYGMFFKKLDETTFALYILMELAAMDWESQIKNKQISKILYTEMELVDTLKQIVSCLSFLQRNSISHRDIKPHNILIFGDGRRNNSKSNVKNSCLIKVSDFGEARISQGNNSNKLYTIKGTELFMSPKLIECYQKIEKEVDHNPYKSDCFSLGLCLLYAASLNINSVYDIKKEIQEKASISATINRYLKLKFSKKFIDLLSRMLSIDESKRIDFVELNEHLKKY